MSDSTETTTGDGPCWQPLSSVQRRVIGVLVEKAKTTADAYPLTLNALTTGCNQKSNRAPKMELSTSEIEEALEHLRGVGAVTEIQGGGRVSKYRHHMYTWLGVDKVELAVIAELLLRGEQTIGELRGRAARMEPIADVATLRPVLQSLTQKNLVVALTPEGRGQIVTHNLYPPGELERRRQKAQQVAPSSPPERSSNREAAPPPSDVNIGEIKAELASLRTDLEQLRGDVLRLKQERRPTGDE